MSPSTHRVPSPSSSDDQCLDRLAGEVKKTKKPSKPMLKFRNGLLRTEIPDRSELMQIAKRNSVESPLLRLPGEIRNIIWEHAVGHHDIKIEPVGLIKYGRLRYHANPMVLSGIKRPHVFVKPTFTLPHVCRQTYIEASAMIYTLNTFGFWNRPTFDCFIRNRALGQRRLITSIVVPVRYFVSYLKNYRKCFHLTFPNIKCVLLLREESWYLDRFAVSMWVDWYGLVENDRKKRLEGFMKRKEGVDIEIDW